VKSTRGRLRSVGGGGRALAEDVVGGDARLVLADVSEELAGGDIAHGVEPVAVHGRHA
jgi:hypothetical protein